MSDQEKEGLSGNPEVHDDSLQEAWKNLWAVKEPVLSENPEAGPAAAEAPVPEGNEPVYPEYSAPPAPPQTPYGATPQGAPQPVYGQPQPGYYQVPAYYGYPMPPKKKMSTGLKVFIWVASILAGIAILGFSGYLIYSTATREVTQIPGSSFLPDGDNPWPFGGNPYSPQEPGDEDDVPDFDDGIVPPDTDATPDVDVTPNSEGITIEGLPSGDPLTAQEVYNKVVKSTVTVAASREQNGQVSTGTGTGIIATSDGYIITNSHVVMNSKSTSVRITTYDGQDYDAVVVGVDRSTDLAVLKTNDHDFSPAEFGDSELLVIGDSVVAIGNPGGEKFSGSMTGGYISGLDRTVGDYSENGMTYIQTDAAINPGNSGGPLVNMYGQVVGINSSKIVTDGYEGMGFAIPVTKAKAILDQLLSGGYVQGRVRLGITGSDVTYAMSAMYGVPQGFMIQSIGEDSSFADTEAQPGDIIVEMDGKAVNSLAQITNQMLRFEPGDTVEIILYRPTASGAGGTEFTVTVTLLEDKGETQQ